jgi:hypothetical protein
MCLKKWLVFLSCLALIPSSAFAQYLGSVSIQTVQAQLATAGIGPGTCTGLPQNFITNAGIQNFANIGQSIHQASASSAAASFTMEIDGIDVLGNVVRISSPTIQYQPTNALNGYVAQGSGYYPNIQVTVTCTAAATFSLSYSGSTGGGGSSILTTPGTNPVISPTLAADVQGIFPRTFNGGTAYPLITGALGPAINAPFAQAGIDTFNSTSTFINGGTTGNVTLAFPPQPSNAGEFAIAFYGPLSAVGGVGVIAPWVALSGSTGQGDINVSTLANYTTKNGLVESFSNGGGTTAGVNIIAFAKAPSLIANQQYRSAASTNAFTPVAGSTLMVAFSCNPATCILNPPTDTQGNTFRLVSESFGTDNLSTGRNIWVYEAIASTAVSDTITGTAASGAITFTALDEFRNPTPAGLNTPSIPIFAAPGGTNANGSVVNENDNGGLFTEAGGYSYTQSITLAAAGTTTVSLFQQPLTGVFYSCTVALRVTAASGTTPTLDTFFQDSGDNIGFNDRMHFPQATTTGNFLGAVSGGVGGITPVATTDGVLAVSTKLDGPLSSFGRLKFVVGGTTPSFTITFNVACR